LGLEIDGQGHEVAWHEFYGACIAQEVRKFLAQSDLHAADVEAFKRAMPRLLEEDREDLGWVQSGRSATVAFARGEQFLLPTRLEPLPKGIY
jgi:hypothetical protein